MEWLEVGTGCSVRPLVTILQRDGHARKIVDAKVGPMARPAQPGSMRCELIVEQIVAGKILQCGTCAERNSQPF